MALNGEFVVNKSDAPEPATGTPPVPHARQVTTGVKHRVGVFSTYVEDPDGVKFQNQEDVEEIVLLVRKDFITNLPWIVIVAALAVLPIFVPYIQRTFLPFLSLSMSINILTLALYYLALFGFAFLSYATWYFQVGLVTNIRVVDVNVPNLLSREISESFLDLIRDVSYTQNGVTRSFFDFGDVVIQTAAPMTTIVYDAIPRPGEVSHIISNLVEEKERV